MTSLTAPPGAPAPLTEAAMAAELLLLLLSPLALAGVALINAGLGRSRSAAQTLLGSLGAAAAAAIGFLVLGAALAGGPGHAIQAAGKSWNWIGSGPLFLIGAASASMQTQLELLFEFVAVAMTAIIPWGSGADRLRLAAGFAIAAVLSLAAFPVLAHWTWGGGWLSQLGTNFGLGAGFLDPSGAATIHLLGGISALAVVWIAGSRKGKFPKEGFATAMPGHNAVYILFGCLVALAGFLGFNLAGALLWLHLPLAALPIAAINTLLAASGALAATFTVTRVRFGKPDASLCANGWLAGLVVSSACAALVSPFAALLAGAAAGIATPLLVELLELGVTVDDPSGAVAVHAAGALLGLLAAGIFAPARGQLLAQLVGIAAIAGLFLPLVYLLFFIVNRFIPFRVDPDGERIGMDLHELGGGAYPEFVIHRDDSYR